MSQQLRQQELQRQQQLRQQQRQDILDQITRGRDRRMLMDAQGLTARQVNAMSPWARQSRLSTLIHLRDIPDAAPATISATSDRALLRHNQERAIRTQQEIGLPALPATGVRVIREGYYLSRPTLPSIDRDSMERQVVARTEQQLESAASLVSQGFTEDVASSLPTLPPITHQK